MYERLLVPLESEPAEVALHHAKAIARKFDSKLFVALRALRRRRTFAD